MARGGRGGGGGGPSSREVQVSKKISWLLRHGAEKEGLQLGSGGYVSVKDVLENRNIRSLKVTFDELRAIVADNDKQRFSLILASDIPANAASISPADYLIRANQGHSIAVESEGLLTQITLDDIPEMVVHGTTHGAWPLIVKTGGLKRMGRNHVHFASGLPAGFKTLKEDLAWSRKASKEELDAFLDSGPIGPAVISGMRNSSQVVIFVDTRKAINAGIKFWRSENGVILSEGDEEGVVPLPFFERVEDHAGGMGILAENGVVLKQAPEAWANKGTGRRGGKGGRGGGRGRGRGADLNAEVT